MDAARQLAADSRRQRQRSAYDDLLRAATVGRFARISTSVSCSAVGGRPAGRHVRHQRFADLAVHRLRIRRHRDPARRRSDPPRRDRSSALHRHRWLGQSGIADPLFAALGALDRQRSAARRPQSRSPRTATASSWPKAPARWCWKAWNTRKARGAKILGVHVGLRRNGGLVPPHAFEPGRQADHRLHPQCSGRCRADARRHRLHQPAWHRHARERQDGISRHHRRCSASAPSRSRSPPTNR